MIGARATSLLLALGLPGAVGCDDDPPEPPASAVTKDSAVWTMAAQQARLLTHVRAAGAKVDGLTEEPCPDEAIHRHLGSGAGRLLTADGDYLARYEEPGKAPRRRSDGPWDFLVTPALLEVRGPVELESKPAAVDAVSRMQELWKTHRYFAVIHATERRAPTLQDDKFVAGAFAGWVIIVDAGARRICQAEFSTTTPEDVAMPQGKDPADALMADFAMRIRGTLDDAVKRITAHLTLDLG